jgi:hypothetical protein
MLVRRDTSYSQSLAKGDRLVAAKEFIRDSPDDSQTNANIHAFLALLQD